jgi:phosphate transport system permease protein
MLTASVVLAIMVTPTLTALSREVFKSIPRIQREAALALGATRWEMIRISVLASARSGLGAATILAWGRALGETMAVTMVIGNRPQIEASLFAPAQTLASVLANEYAEASEGLHLSALSAVGLALLLVSVVVHFLARIFIRSGTSGSAS